MTDELKEAAKVDYREIKSINEAWVDAFANYVEGGQRHSHQHIFYQGVKAGYAAAERSREDNALLEAPSEKRPITEQITFPVRYDADWTEVRDALSRCVADTEYAPGNSHVIGRHIAHVLNTHNALLEAARAVVEASDISYYGEFHISEKLIDQLKAAIAGGGGE
jgi:hypothetical protein